MSSSLRDLYETHHEAARGEGFSIMKSSRGKLFAEIVGTGKRVLDIGCRDGALTSFFTKGNTVLGVDIDTKSLERAKARLKIETLSFDLQSDWSELADRTFDVAVAGELLEHVYYPNKVVQKTAAHLTSTGMFVGSVPNAFSLKNRLRYLFARKKHTPLADPTHINHFPVREFKEMLGDSFGDVQIVGLGRFEFLARVFPQWFAFDVCFVAKNPKRE